MTAKTSRADAMELRAKAIAACRNAQGRITPTAVWQAAREPASPLHNEFEWDVKIAATKEWERRAAELIREVRFIVEYEDRKIAVPFYVSDPRINESGYITTAKVAQNAAMSERVLRDELDRIASAIRRAMNLAAAFGLSSSFERMLEQATEIEKRLAGDDVGDEARV